jgi:hypothetical protein
MSDDSLHYIESTETDTFHWKITYVTENIGFGDGKVVIQQIKKLWP